MRILSCYISAFGGLSNYNIDFSSDITCVFEQNGFGKTTLAAFIKAMFYGMPTARKGAAAENNARIKYYPWSGGNFGGQLVFSFGEKTYRIIRSFDRTSAVRDSFQLVDAESGRECYDFNEDIGVQIFGVDEDGFSRSTFSNGTPRLDGLPSSIRSKISSMVDCTDDFDDYDKAFEKLSKAVKALEGKNGLIEDSARKIQLARNESERCRRDAEEFLRLGRHAVELENERKEIESRILELNKKLAAAATAEADALKLQRYKKLCDSCLKLEQSIKQIEQKYGGACPDEDTAQKLDTLFRQHSQAEVLLLSERQKLGQEEYKKLWQLFSEGVPSESELENLSDNLRTSDILLNQAEDLKRKIEQKNRELELARVCLDGDVSDTTLNQMRMAGTRVSASFQGRNIKTNCTPLFIIAAVVLAAGLVVCAFHLVAGIALSAVGAVGLIAVMLLSSVKKMLGVADTVVDGTERDAVREFLQNCGFSPDADVNMAVDKIKAARTLCEETEKDKQALENVNSQLADALSAADGVLSRYTESFEQNRTTAFEELKTRLSRYLNELLPSMEKAEALEKSVAKAEGEIRRLFSSVCYEAQGVSLEAAISEIKADISAYRDAAAQLEKLKGEAQACFVSDKIAEISEAEVYETAEQISAMKETLDRKTEEINRELAEIRQTMQPLSSAQTELNEQEEIVESESEKQQEYKERLNILKKTIELLQSAKNELSKKYAGSISSAFERYSQIFFGGNSQQFLISPDLNLTVNREGVGRAAELFSEGQRSVMDVCLRLSLIDAMFEREKPFLILDDPFASMDDDNFKKSAELLKKIGSEIQIVYFTCHSSRKI